MMSFYPGSFCAPAPELTFSSMSPLFRFLEGVDSYYNGQAEAPVTAPRRQARREPRRRAPVTPTFTPRFDVRETESAYELHGELPGLERQNVNIEFTEPQTLVIRGRVERNYGGTTNSNSNSSAAQQQGEEEEAQPEEPKSQSSSRRGSYQATVEDDPDDENYTPSSTPATASPGTEPAKPAGTGTGTGTEQITPSTSVATTGQQQQPAYWQRWERSVGEFSRAFAFPSRVDVDGVSARLENGILSVVVPKAREPAVRRIAIA